MHPAIESFDATPSEPLAPVIFRARGLDPAPLLAYWREREPGSLTSWMRYRWDISHRRSAIPRWVRAPETWRAWRPAEQPIVDKDPFDFEERLVVPILVAECAELLLERPEAKDLLDEAEPALRRDLAFFVQALHASTDMFALARLVARPRALAHFQPLAVALSASYAALAERAGGKVTGTRFPMHDVPLASASAQLASGLVALGMSLDLVARLVAFVRAERRASGAWGDGAGPDDPMTTLAACDLLARLDPAFDPSGALAYFAKIEEPEGWFRALGPEVPWLTCEVHAWRARAKRPFAERFEWPRVLDANLDQKTRLPFYAHYTDLARLFGGLSGLAAAGVSIAFLDLAGFRAFNNAHGQEKGDLVLAAFAAELAKIGAARAIRDGGDEFLLVGAPTRARLFEDLDALRLAWPAVFRARFGEGAPVAPRILVTEASGAEVIAARERLGRAIGALKHDTPRPGEKGVLARA